MAEDGRSGRCSPGSADSTSDSNAPDGDADSKSRSTSTDAASSPDGGQTSLVSPTSEAFNWQTGGSKDFLGLAPETSLARKQTPAVLTSSAADSHARTSPSPDGGAASRANARRYSSSSHGSPGLFDLDGSSLRMYPDSYPVTVAEISPSFSRRWPTSGMAWHGECWTLDTSESPRDAVECSLSAVLEPDPPTRFYLSSKAARGILRRADRRGRILPEHLEAALRAVADPTTSSEIALAAPSDTRAATTTSKTSKTER